MTHADAREDAKRLLELAYGAAAVPDDVRIDLLVFATAAELLKPSPEKVACLARSKDRPRNFMIACAMHGYMNRFGMAAPAFFDRLLNPLREAAARHLAEHPWAAAPAAAPRSPAAKSIDEKSVHELTDEEWEERRLEYQEAKARFPTPWKQRKQPAQEFPR